MKFLLFALILTTGLTLNAQEKNEKLVKKNSFVTSLGLNKPYSVFLNPSDNFYYIANVMGHPDAENNQAQISVLVFKDYEHYEPRHLKNNLPISTQYPKTTLSAPKGMVAWDNYLVIADLNALAIFKTEVGKRPKQVARFPVKGAKSLDSIVRVDEVLYISDSKAGGIYKISNFEDKQNRKIEALTKVPSPTGMIYDTENDSLLIVSSKVNKLYEFNLTDKKKSAAFTIGTKSDTNRGFTGICMGNQRELYLTHYDLGRIFVYFRDADRPATIKKTMKVAKTFIKDLTTPTGIIYDSSQNRIAFLEFEINQLTFKNGLAPQNTSESLKE